MLRIPNEIQEQFYLGLSTSTTKFGVNAPVTISTGPYQGSLGAVISIVTIDPRVRYVVELSSGQDIEVNEAELSPTVRLWPCLCCGYATLTALNNYDICPICWWEDDGQDSEDADEIRGGPNYELSLTQARLNFIEQGISCPDRLDLRDKQQDHSDFKRLRVFVKRSDQRVVEESV